MRTVAFLFVLLGFVSVMNAAESRLDFWPAWRGPLQSGVAPNAELPTEWSEKKNLRWKLDLPGKGHSTPIVWGNLVFVTAAVPVGKEREPVYSKVEGAHDNFPVSQVHRFVVLAVNRKTGKVAWEAELKREFPHEGGHYTGSLASNSPVTDGLHIYVFMGSRGLFCLNFAGEIVWQKDMGRMETRHAHGEGSSPALHGETLVVNWDHQKQSRLMAFNTRIGKKLWEVKRDEMTSWSSPLIVEHAGKMQVVVSATGAVRGYDLKDGSVIWECKGLSRNVVASPVAGEGMVFAANSYDWQAMLAIELAGAKGDVTDTEQVVWKLNRLTPYVPSPLYDDGALIFLRHNQNILSFIDAKTGENIDGPYRLGGIREVFASPIAADGHVYVADRSGNTLVLRRGKALDFLGVNRLEDKFSASPAAAGGELYLRGEKFLYCIAED